MLVYLECVIPATVPHVLIKYGRLRSSVLLKYKLPKAVLSFAACLWGTSVDNSYIVLSADNVSEDNWWFLLV